MESIEHIVEALKITTTVAILFVWFVRYDNIKKNLQHMDIQPGLEI